MLQFIKTCIGGGKTSKTSRSRRLSLVGLEDRCMLSIIPAAPSFTEVAVSTQVDPSWDAVTGAMGYQLDGQFIANDPFTSQNFADQSTGAVGYQLDGQFIANDPFTSQNFADQSIGSGATPGMEEQSNGLQEAGGSLSSEFHSDGILLFCPPALDGLQPAIQAPNTQTDDPSPIDEVYPGHFMNCIYIGDQYPFSARDF